MVRVKALPVVAVLLPLWVGFAGAEQESVKGKFVGPLLSSVAGGLEAKAQGGSVFQGVMSGLQAGASALMGQQPASPKIAVKLMPNKHVKISPRELRSILGNLRQEIREQVSSVVREYQARGAVADSVLPAPSFLQQTRYPFRQIERATSDNGEEASVLQDPDLLQHVQKLANVLRAEANIFPS